MQTQQGQMRRAPGLIYRIGTASVVFGLVVMLCSGLLAGVMSDASNGLVLMIGADGRNDSDSSLQISDGASLALAFGVGIVLAGSMVYCLRFLFELLGLTNARHLTASFTFVDKLIAGLAMIETILFIATIVPAFLLEEMFAQDSSILSSAIPISFWLMIGGWVIYLVKRTERVPNLFGWMVDFGWGRADWAIINLAATAMILIASVIRLFGAETFFGLFTMNSVIAIGFVLIATGIIPHFLAGKRP